MLANAPDLGKKHADFNAFFMLEHNINLNIEWLADDQGKPDMRYLQDTLPDAFAIINEAAALEKSALRPIPSLGEQGEQLMMFLTLQSRKMDILLSSILQQEDNPSHRYHSKQFGAAGCVVLSDNPIQVGTYAQLKMFIREEAAAIFCYAEVISCDLLPDSDVYQLRLLYTVIREMDQEVLVRCALHLQTQQLRARQQGSD